MESIKTIKFLKAYVKSMRLYYSFITGITGLIGLSYYQYKLYISGNSISEDFFVSDTRQPSLFQILIIMLIIFLSWGINQIYNDYLGIKEDRINAPERPMVTGELNPVKALILSTVLMLGALIITWFCLGRDAVIPLAVGVGLNIVYEYAKSYGVLANVVFGIMISMCAIYSFLASGASLSSALAPDFIILAFYLALLNGLMTFYTYFKDYEGDKQAGKKTVIVKMGLEKARDLSVVAAFLPVVIFMVIYYGTGLWNYNLNNIFVELAILSTGLQLWTGILFYKNPKGAMTYFSLSINFRACACSESAIISIFNPALGVLLFLLSYFFIGFLFNFHTNTKG